MLGFHRIVGGKMKELAVDSTSQLLLIGKSCRVPKLKIVFPSGNDFAVSENTHLIILETCAFHKRTDETIKLNNRINALVELK